MEEYIKVKNKDYLYRDSISNGIVNADINEYHRYIQNYSQRFNESKKIQTIENDLNGLKNDIIEIKNLLRNLSNGS